MPLLPFRILLLVAAFMFFATLVQLGILTIAFDKLGLSSQSASLLFITIVAGSMVNLPLFSMKAGSPAESAPPPRLHGLFRVEPVAGKIVVAVNVGGCVVPVAFCIYLLRHNPLNPFHVLLAVAAVAALSYATSRRLPGIGIGVPVFVPPFAAALVSVVLDPPQAAPLAYVSGTLGVLIGADLLHLKSIRGIGVPFASIGGAGSFDGIFLTGVVAVLLT